LRGRRLLVALLRRSRRPRRRRRDEVRALVGRLPARPRRHPPLRRERPLALEARGPLHRRHGRPRSRRQPGAGAVLGPVPPQDDGAVLAAMTRRRLHSLFLLVLVAALGIGAARGAPPEEGAFVVIVHPDNATAALNRDFVRDAYLKKATDWPSGETIRP